MVDKARMSVPPFDVRMGSEAALARVVSISGAVHPNDNYLGSIRASISKSTQGFKGSAPFAICILSLQHYLEIGLGNSAISPRVTGETDD
jgi:hypothetical protein